MAAPALTTGCLLEIKNTKRTDLKPVVQVVDVKRIGAQTPSASAERYRMAISDGAYIMQAMLTTQLNDLVKNDQLTKNCVIRVTEYLCQDVQNKKVIIVIQLETLSGPIPQIGNPVNVDDPTAPTGAVSAQPAFNAGQPRGPLPSANGYGGPGPNVGNPYVKPEPAHHGGYGGNTGASYGGAPQQYHQQQGGYGAPAGGYSGGYGAPSNAAGGYSTSGPGGFGNKPMNRPAAGAIERTDAVSVQPIASLNPYQNRWTFRARIVNKSDLKTWANARGEGQVFSIDLVDGSGEIRASFFNDAARKWYDQLQVNHVYIISKGTLKPSRKQFTTIKNDYELSLDVNSTIQEVQDDQSIPKQQFHITKISELERVPDKQIVDLMGIVKTAGHITTITSKAGKELTKRDVTLVDDSGVAISLTLWDNFARIDLREQDINSGENPVLLAKGVRTSEFNGKQVGSMSTSFLDVNPDIPEAAELKGWWQQHGQNMETHSLSKQGTGGAFGGGLKQRKTVAQARDEELGKHDQPDYFVLRAIVTYIPHNNSIWYPACPGQLDPSDPSRVCNKKMTELTAQCWSCERCSRQYDYCKYRYILNVSAADHTGTIYLGCFDEVGAVVLGKTADEMSQIKASGDEALFESVFSEASFKPFLFKVRAKSDTYNDETRVRYSVLNAEPLNFVNESRLLTEIISCYNRG